MKPDNKMKKISSCSPFRCFTELSHYNKL